MTPAHLLLGVLFLLSGGARPPKQGKRRRKTRADQEAARQARVLATLPYTRPAAHKYGVPLPVVLAVLDVESHGWPRATSPVGAMGYMQLMPATAAHYIPGKDPYDPQSNINGGVKLLAELWAKYKDWAAVFTAYNAGERRLKKNKKNYRMVYVREVLARFPLYKDIK